MHPGEENPGRQLRALFTVALLSPVLRLIPGSAAALGGRAAWLGPLAALPLLLVHALLLDRLRDGFRDGETLPVWLLRVLGPRAGRMLLLLLGLWLLLYGGFVLRAGAERFQITIYPRSGPGFFVLTLGLLGLYAALGSVRSLVRVARMTEPILLATLLLLLLAAARHLERSELLPLTGKDAGALLRGALPSLDILSLAPTAACFFTPNQGARRGRFRQTALWLCGMALLMTALGAAVQGSFGAALCARLSAPFFTLVRNLVFFRSLERLEALVVGLWLFPDFLMVSLSLQASQRCLRLALGQRPQWGESRSDLGKGRWLIWLSGAVATFLGLFLAPDPASLLFWSRTLIPLLNCAFTLVAVPGLLAAGKLRRNKTT
jgi:spore germination protein KB